MDELSAKIGAGFVPLPTKGGRLLDLTADGQPLLVGGWSGSTLLLSKGATHFGMVTAGECTVATEDEHIFMLRPGMYFVTYGRTTVLSADGEGLVISSFGYRGLRQVGGPIESEGRLRYIDGCTDTLLVCPPRLGEPCLNHLHIPPHTSQTAHTHPSHRVGVILRGSGECRTADGVFPLSPGMGWYIPEGSVHSFFTGAQSLDVIAWHPDSDFGPTDENHPMVNRTIIENRQHS
jgi:quercetin dioxygenase-like cupin family protein